MATRTEQCADITSTGCEQGSLTGRATRFEPKNWWPDHIQPPRTTFVAARHAIRMWKL